MLDTVFGDMEGVNLGLDSVEGAETLRLAYLVRSNTPLPAPQGPPPDPEYVRSLLDNSLETDFGPRTDIVQ